MGVEGATVTLTGAGLTFTEITNSNGSFSLTFDRTGIPDTVAFTVVKGGYIPLALALTLNASSGTDVGNLVMEIQGPEVVVIEIDPDLHHLGDNSFSGSFNSQFQKSAEGTVYSRSFNVTSSQLSGSSATITLLAKGLQFSNPLSLNNNVVAILNSSPADGSFETISISNVSMSNFRAGTNTLTIASGLSGSDFDDFEFTNVVIRFNNIGSSSAIPQAPVGVVASDGLSSGFVTVSWIPLSDASSYTVYRCTSTQTSSCLFTSNITSSSYNYPEGEAGVVYFYRVKACNTQALCSDYSDADSGYFLSDQSPSDGLNPSYDSGVLFLPAVAVDNIFETVYYAVELVLITSISNYDLIVTAAEAIADIENFNGPTFNPQDNTLSIPELTVDSIRYSAVLQLLPDSSPPTFRLISYQEL